MTEIHFSFGDDFGQNPRLSTNKKSQAYPQTCPAFSTFFSFFGFLKMPSGTPNFQSGCVNVLIYSSCGTGFENDVGTRRTWSSFSSLNFLPVFKHRALCPRMAKTCGGMERP